MNPLKDIRKLKTDILPLEHLNFVLGDKSSDAKKSYLKRACQKGDLIRLKNGLYLLGEEHRRGTLHPLAIANHVQTPSYVSLESALSYYELIPEAVYTTTSVTTKASLEQDTPIGHFSFSHLKSNYFNFGFYRATDDGHHFLVATPLKALVDYIVLRKKTYRNMGEIVEDLRFDFETFRTQRNFVNTASIDEMLGIYKSYRLQLILRDLRKKA